MKNFALGLEWIWSREKFLDRKALMTEMYDDFRDDGKINRDKFKNFDPFFESPDTPTQIGTSLVMLKPLAYLMPSKSDYKIVDLKSREAGLLNVELIACDASGKPLSEKDSKIRDPKTDLANKTISFQIRINSTQNINALYEVLTFIPQIYQV